ncbi:hypothetical protein EI555_011251 [Monodon monoceros]|uniref:Uncharacterized protein n=1 Tax=Monodon monoceros TaxID=40151 RepID=A0A4U1EIR7_MONMO|nr:hypothetical protein EI555_011251 [Monodon monoceros]
MSWKRSFWFYHCQKKRYLFHSRRAELHFPMSRVNLLLQEACYAQCLSSSTTVFQTSNLEYVTVNTVEQGGPQQPQYAHHPGARAEGIGQQAPQPPLRARRLLSPAELPPPKEE